MIGSVLSLSDSQALYDEFKRRYDIYQTYGVLTLPGLSFSRPVAYQDLREWYYKVMKYLDTFDEITKYFVKQSLDTTWESTGLIGFKTNNVDTLLNLADLPYGFRRKVTGNPGWLYGLPEPGDELGDWHYEDINACIEAMQYFIAKAHLTYDNTSDGAVVIISETFEEDTSIRTTEQPVVFWDPPGINEANTGYQSDRADVISACVSRDDSQFNLDSGFGIPDNKLSGRISAAWHVDYEIRDGLRYWVCTGESTVGYYTSWSDVAVFRNLTEGDIESYKCVYVKKVNTSEYVWDYEETFNIVTLVNNTAVYPVSLDVNSPLSTTAPDEPENFTYTKAPYMSSDSNYHKGFSYESAFIAKISTN